MQPPEPVPDPDGDKLATIAARFSYFQERKNTLTTAKVDLRRNINPPARYKNARPTVRLRPRQVLCSKCRSICNENSENVDVSRKRKHDEIQQEQQQPQQQQVIRNAIFFFSFFLYFSSAFSLHGGRTDEFLIFYLLKTRMTDRCSCTFVCVT